MLQRVQARPDPRMEGDAILRVLPRPASAEMSPFEQAILPLVDGVRTNAEIAAALGVGLDDLSIALVPLLQNGWVDGMRVRPAAQVTPLPVNRPPRNILAHAGGTHDDRHGAASLQAASLRALRRGDLREARTLAERAASLAPGVTGHRDVLNTWDEHVARHLGADLRGDARVGAFRAWSEVSPRSARAWLSLAAQLAEQGQPGAADAAEQAVKVAATDELKKEARAFAARVGREGTLARIRSIFGAPAGEKRRS